MFLCGSRVRECSVRHPRFVSSNSRVTSSPLCLTIVVLLIPHQLQLSSSLRYTLAPRSSRQRTAQVTQLLTDLSPALYVLLIADGLRPLRLYVRRSNTTPSPWWLLCLQWSVPPTTRKARAAVRVDRPTSLVSVSCIMSGLCIYMCSSLACLAGAVRRDALRNGDFLP